MLLIYLLLGSNIGDRAKYLENACERIEKRIGKITQKSPIYETAAWGKEDQSPFLNQAIEVYTTCHDPKETLAILLEIEKELGRVRVVKWGERVIDIDIIFFGDSIVEEENLIIPHPQIQNRMFTLIPLADIAGDFIHPVFQLTVNQLVDLCKDRLFICKFS